MAEIRRGKKEERKKKPQDENRESVCAISKIVYASEPLKKFEVSR